MQKITSDLYLIDQPAFTKLLKQPLLNPDIYFENQKATSLKGCIIIHEEELLNLMQASVERGITTLTRQRAEELLNATILYNK